MPRSFVPAVNSAYDVRPAQLTTTPDRVIGRPHEVIVSASGTGLLTTPIKGPVTLASSTAFPPEAFPENGLRRSCRARLKQGPLPYDRRQGLNPGRFAPHPTGKPSILTPRVVVVIVTPFGSTCQTIVQPSPLITAAMIGVYISLLSSDDQPRSLSFPQLHPTKAFSSILPFSAVL
ncbi:hypothetical protein VUR80DRAFT_6880 [Thermomyces stellatus]